MKRLLFLLALAVMVFAGTTSVRIVRADDNPTVTIKAQGNPYFSDFMSMSNKRSDLRINIANQGWDVAFTKWLKAERPGAYRDAAAATLASVQHHENGVEAASTYCCASGGKCCQTNCSQCCAKGACRMSCCEMKGCKELHNACCR